MSKLTFKKSAHLVIQYGNETGVGKGIAAGLKDAGVEREDLFVTSKLYHTDHRAARVVPALKKTLSDLNLNNVDCWMMHAPWAFEPKVITFIVILFSKLRIFGDIFTEFF